MQKIHSNFMPHNWCLSLSLCILSKSVQQFLLPDDKIIDIKKTKKKATPKRFRSVWIRLCRFQPSFADCSYSKRGLITWSVSMDTNRHHNFITLIKNTHCWKKSIIMEALYYCTSLKFWLITTKHTMERKITLPVAGKDLLCHLDSDVTLLASVVKMQQVSSKA